MKETNKTAFTSSPAGGPQGADIQILVADESHERYVDTILNSSGIKSPSLIIAA